MKSSVPELSARPTCTVSAVTAAAMHQQESPMARSTNDSQLAAGNNPPPPAVSTSARIVADSNQSRGLTVADVARRYRVSPDKVRAWIRRGELAAVNTADRLCGKPRFVVTEDALADFERARSAAAPTPTRSRHRGRKAGFIDFYPSDN